MEKNSTISQFVNVEFPGDRYTRLAWLIFLSFVLILGVIGNSLILRVYSTKTLKTCTHVLIMALALTDLTICLLLSLDICSLALLIMNSPTPLVLNYSRYIRTSTVGASVGITVLIAVDRRDCVCRPHRRFLTPRRGKKAAWIAVVFSFIGTTPDLINRVTPRPAYSIISLFLQSVYFIISLVVIAYCYRQVFKKIRTHVKVFSMTKSSSLVTEWSTRFQPAISKPKDLGESIINKSTKSISDRLTDDCSNRNDSTSQHITMENRPQQTNENQMVSVATNSKDDADCNVRDTHCVVTSVDQPAVAEIRFPVKPEKNGATLQRKTTFMLFITSLVFLLSWLPYWIFVALTIIDSSGSSVSQQLMDISHAILIVLFANNALNPLVYGIANRRFRKDCLNVFRKVKVTKQ